MIDEQDPPPETNVLDEIRSPTLIEKKEHLCPLQRSVLFPLFDTAIDMLCNVGECLGHNIATHGKTHHLMG